MTSLGAELHRLMAERGLRPGDVAARAGLSPTFLSDVIHDRRSLTARTCVRLSRVLGIAPEALAEIQVVAYRQRLLEAVARQSEDQ